MPEKQFRTDECKAKQRRPSQGKKVFRGTGKGGLDL